MSDMDAYDGTDDDLMTAEELARDRASAGLGTPGQAASVIAKPRRKAKKAAADDPETAETVAGLAQRADAIIAGLTAGQDGAA